MHSTDRRPQNCAYSPLRCQDPTPCTPIHARTENLRLFFFTYLIVRFTSVECDKPTSIGHQALVCCMSSVPRQIIHAKVIWSGWDFLLNLNPRSMVSSSNKSISLVKQSLVLRTKDRLSCHNLSKHAAHLGVLGNKIWQVWEGLRVFISNNSTHGDCQTAGQQATPPGGTMVLGKCQTASDKSMCLGLSSGSLYLQVALKMLDKPQNHLFTF